jgi:FeS assembly SUF system protein
VPPDSGPSGEKTKAQEEVPPVKTDALASYAEQKEEAKKRVSEAAAAGDQAPVVPSEIQEKIAEVLRTVHDPEIPVNIYELGLIYEVKVEESGMAYVKMTLTSPNCPAAAILPAEVESKTRSVSGVRDVTLDLVFDPPWNPEMMSEAAKLELGML